MRDAKLNRVPSRNCVRYPVFVTAGGATILEGKGRKEIVWVFFF
jgi:hypothetical protein